MDVRRRGEDACGRGDDEVVALRLAMDFEIDAVRGGDALESDHAVAEPSLGALRFLPEHDDAEQLDHDMQLGRHFGLVADLVDDVGIAADIAEGRMDDPVFVDLPRGVGG